MIPWMTAWLACGAPQADHRTEATVAETGSVYDLGLTVITDGGEVPLDRWRGHPLVVSQVYAGCREVCPRTIEAIRGIEGQVPEDRRSDVQVLLVSLDPTDTPADLKEIAVARGADPTRWTFATSTPDGIRALAAALGVRYRPLPDGSISHSAVITLLGSDGAIVERVDGLGTSTEALAARLARGD